MDSNLLIKFNSIHSTNIVNQAVKQEDRAAESCRNEKDHSNEIVQHEAAGDIIGTVLASQGRSRPVSINHDQGRTMIDEKNVIGPRSRPIVPTKPNFHPANQHSDTDSGLPTARNIEHNPNQVPIMQQSSSGHQLHNDNNNSNRHNLQPEAPKRADVKSLISRFSVS